jgi:hypothetical protein
MRPLACAGERRVEGGSALMQMQVREGPSRSAGQGRFAAQEIKQGTRSSQLRLARSRNLAAFVEGVS